MSWLEQVLISIILYATEIILVFGVVGFISIGILSVSGKRSFTDSDAISLLLLLILGNVFWLTVLVSDLHHP